MIVRREPLIPATKAEEQCAFRVPSPAVHRVDAGRSVQRLDRRLRFPDPLERDGHFTERVRVPRIELEEPLAHVDGRLV